MIDERAAGRAASLLGSRRFLPLFLTQFLGAFNDQVYQKAFVALLTYRLAEGLGLPLETLGVIASALFILPFALITPLAGQIADRVDKARMMRVVKFSEIVVMSLAAIGFHLQSVEMLYFVLFLMGAQSAMFAPIKYSVLPQYLRRRELMRGNGLVQASTFLAIIFGTIAGNELILTEGGVLVVSALVIAVAAAGFLASLAAPPAPPLGPARPIDPFFLRAIWRLIGEARRRRAAFLTILSISWFWFLGASFLSLLPAYARDALDADEGVLTALLTGFSVGVAIGAVLAARLTRGEIGLAAPPIGAVGSSLFAVELWLATQAAPGIEGAGLHDRASFFSSVAGWRILFDFVGLAACAGLYVTPLNALLQVLSPASRRARFIAASNVMDAIFIVASAALAAALVALGLGAIEILTLFALSGLAMAAAIARRAPDTPAGKMWLRIAPASPAD